MDFPAIASQFGIPLAILAAVLAAVWKIANRLIDDVAKPVAMRHISYLDSKETNDKQMVKTLESIAERQQEHIIICRTDRQYPAHT